MSTIIKKGNNEDFSKPYIHGYTDAGFKMNNNNVVSNNAISIEAHLVKEGIIVNADLTCFEDKTLAAYNKLKDKDLYVYPTIRRIKKEYPYEYNLIKAHIKSTLNVDLDGVSKFVKEPMTVIEHSGSNESGDHYKLLDEKDETFRVVVNKPYSDVLSKSIGEKVLLEHDTSKIAYGYGDGDYLKIISSPTKEKKISRSTGMSM